MYCPLRVQSEKHRHNVNRFILEKRKLLSPSCLHDH